MAKQFIAKGKLYDLKLDGILRGIRIDAIMHEGVFGSNHVVKIILDKKFSEDVIKNLKIFPHHDQSSANARAWGWIGGKGIPGGGKSIREHKITIIIE